MISPLRVTGDLREVEMAGLLISLRRSRETGRLELRDGRRQRTLFVKDGDVVFALSSDPDEGLGAHLVRRGRITLAQLDPAAGDVDEDRRLGTVLVERGLLDATALVDAVRDQLEEIVCGAIRTDEGEYGFDFAPLELREVILIHRKLPALVLRAMRGVERVSRIRRLLGSLCGRHWTSAPSEVWSAWGLEPLERAVIERLRVPWAGGFEVPELAGAGAFAVGRAICVLQLLGAVIPALSTEPVTPVPGEAGPEADAEGAPAGEAPFPASASLRGMIDELNRAQSYLHRITRGEIGPGADVFVRTCLRRSTPEVARLFEGLPLDAEEGWPAPALVSRLPGEPDAARSLLRQALRVQFAALQRMMDHERAAALRSGLVGLPSPELGPILSPEDAPATPHVPAVD